MKNDTTNADRAKTAAPKEKSNATFLGTVQFFPDDVHSSDAAAAFARLYDITRTLRGERGCPWDKDQTPLSLRRDLMEEAFETIDAVTQEDAAHVQEELGDVIFNAVLLAYCYEQEGTFTLADSLHQICDKLVRRHPHVFPQSDGAREMTAPVTDSATVLSQWERIKERVEGRTGDSVLDSVPLGFPPLLRAYKLIAKAEKKHFKWESAEAAFAKVQEELAEMREAAAEVARCKAAANTPQADESGAKQMTADASAGAYNADARITSALTANIGAAQQTTAAKADGAASAADASGSQAMIANAATTVDAHNANRSADMRIAAVTGAPAPTANASGTKPAAADASGRNASASDTQTTANATTAAAAKPFTVSGGTAALNAAQLHLEDEVGDVLFAFVTYARWLGVDASVALDRANRKFYRRFTYVERAMQEHGIPLDGTHSDDEVRFWNEAKQQERT